MSAPDTWRQLTDALLGAPVLTAPEIARAADVDLDFARRLWRALGFPPVPDGDRVFTRTDVAVLQALHDLGDRLSMSPGAFIQLARVTGQTMGRLADAQVNAVVRPKDSPVEAASAAPTNDISLPPLADAVPDLERLVGYVWRRHLLAALLRLAAAPLVGDQSRTVGFADLVGFTTISQSLDTRGLATVVDRFEAVAFEHVIHYGGRIVKIIGDEVLFVADDRGVAAEIALELVAAHATDPLLPDVRVGLAEGPVLAWEGDVLGPTVNLAHRLVTLARPGTIVVANELGQRLHNDPRFALRHLRRARLEGLGRLRSWVLRRAPADR